MKNYLRLFPLFILLSIFNVHFVFADANSDANKFYLDAYNMYKLGKLDESLELLEKVTSLNPNHPEAYFGKGSIYFRQEKFQKAIDEFTKVTEIKPNYVEAYQRLWLAYKKIGMSDKAEQELLKYRKLIEDRMQSMTGSGPQVVKPTSPPKKKHVQKQEQEAVKEEQPVPPKEAKVTQAEPEKAAATVEKTTSPEVRVAESKPPQEVVAKAEKETAEKKPVTEVAKVEEKKQPEAVAVAPVAPPKSKVQSPILPQEPPPVVLETRPSRSQSPLVEMQYKPHLDTRYDGSKYKKVYKGDDPTFKGFMRKLKSAASFLTKNPFKRSDGTPVKSYFARLMKGFAYYVMLIQIWLCVAAAICIYFSKSNNNKKVNS
ncbi:MAG: tetratricopeptide repeat protein [Planctomycetes bacterium]|nr:tetratricopeptide repeat protein [Planctomycetota bacterium]